MIDLTFDQIDDLKELKTSFKRTKSKKTKIRKYLKKSSMDCQTLMKIFDFHIDLAIIIKYFMLIRSLNCSAKDAVFTIIGVMYVATCDYCHVFAFLIERYCLNSKEIRQRVFEK